MDNQSTLCLGFYKNCRTINMKVVEASAVERKMIDKPESCLASAAWLGETQILNQERSYCRA